jgi:hypothetical protein
MFQLSNDTEFSFILSEYLSLANEGGSATGEVLRAAAVIEPNILRVGITNSSFLQTRSVNRLLLLRRRRTGSLLAQPTSDHHLTTEAPTSSCTVTSLILASIPCGRSRMQVSQRL